MTLCPPFPFMPYYNCKIGNIGLLNPILLIYYVAWEILLQYVCIYVAQIKGPEPYLVFKKHFLFKIILTVMLYDK